MDRRFFVALGLSLVVILIWQLLFPPVPTPKPQVAGSDTTAVASSSAAAPAARAAALARSSAADSAHPAAGSKPPEPASAPPETLTVNTAHTQVAFTSIGAAPLSITMRDFHATVRNAADRATSPLVRLGRPGEPLLRYRVLVGHDTLPLDRVAFHGQRTTASDGSPAVTYDADVTGSDGSPRRVTIAYRFGPDGYLAHVDGAIGGPADATAAATGAAGHPPGYLLIDLPSGLQSFEADTLDDLQQLAYTVKPLRDDAVSTSFSRLENGQAELRPGPVSWAVAKDKYFLVGVLAPDTARSHQFAEVNLVGGPKVGKLVTHAAATVVAPLMGPTTPGAAASFAFEMYGGPQEYRRLRAIGRDFENLTPYGGFLHPILQPFATLVIWTVIELRRVLQINYGWVLILFGVLTRIVLWPLNQRAMRSSIKMQRLQPELQEVQTKYKSDPQRQQQEMMRVYRDHGMSPWSPIAGCLPMLLPWPILAALFFVFRNTIEFRGVPFLWMHDISVKDPYYIMPILMGLTSFLVSWIGMRNVPPNPQTKMMSYVFPVMMVVFMYSLPAGLNIYYFAQNLATLPQQWILANERARSAATGGAGAVTADGGGAAAATKPRPRATTGTG